MCNVTQFYSSKCQDGWGGTLSPTWPVTPPRRGSEARRVSLLQGAEHSGEGHTLGWCCCGHQRDQGNGRANRCVNPASLVTPINITKCRLWLDFRWKMEEWSLSSEPDRWKEISWTQGIRNVDREKCEEASEPQTLELDFGPFAYIS